MTKLEEPSFTCHRGDYAVTELEKPSSHVTAETTQLYAVTKLEEPSCHRGDYAVTKLEEPSHVTAVTTR